MPENRDTTFVTVVEPNNALEHQVLLMAESLRQWGGRLANAPILCFSPRFRPPLRRSTLKGFERLNITYKYKNVKHPYSWYSFTNKAMAMVAARDACDAKNLVWLDADVLVLDEPEEFLKDDAEFAACLTRGDLATTGPSHPCDEYWKAICNLYGLDIDKLPWVMAQGKRVRYCIQAGIFRMRRESAIVDHYLGNLEKLMNSKLVASNDIFYNETVALTLAPFTSKATWSELPRSHNFVVSSSSDDGEIAGMETARVLHYHDAMLPTHWNVLRSFFHRRRPDRLEWLEQKGPISPSSALPLQHLMRRFLHLVRQRKKNQFLETCQSIDIRLRTSCCQECESTG